MTWSQEIVEKVGDIAGEEMDGIPSRSHLNAVAHRILIAIERDVVSRAEIYGPDGIRTGQIEHLNEAIFMWHERAVKAEAELEQLRRDSMSASVRAEGDWLTDLLDLLTDLPLDRLGRLVHLANRHRDDVVLRSEMTEERRYDRSNGDRRFVTEWEPLS